MFWNSVFIIEIKKQWKITRNGNVEILTQNNATIRDINRIQVKFIIINTKISSRFFDQTFELFEKLNLNLFVFGF